MAKDEIPDFSLNAFNLPPVLCEDIQYLYFDRVVDRRSEATKKLNIPDPFDTDPSMAFFADQNRHQPSFQSTAQRQHHGGYASSRVVLTLRIYSMIYFIMLLALHTNSNGLF